MAEQKKKRIVYRTPVGVAKYPHLARPDDRPINGKPQRPAYKVRLLLTPEQLQDVRATLDPLIDAAYDEAAAKLPPPKRKKLSKYLPYKEEYLKDDDGEFYATGKWELIIKQNAQIPGRDGRPPINVTVPLYNAARRPIKVNPWSGSEMAVAYTVRKFHNDATDEAGVTLDLSSVMITKLVTAGQRTADQDGWGDVSDEYDVVEGDDVSSAAAGYGDEFSEGENGNHTQAPADF